MKMILNSDWLTLAEAAKLLGVHTATLRRWANEGDMPVMLTQGGHRRFARADVERRMSSRASAARSSAPPDALAVQTLAHAREALPAERNAHWMATLDSATRERHRALGRSLLGLTLQYVASDDGDALLNEARTLGREYARISRAGGMSLTDALQAALFFRDRLMEAALDLPASARERKHDHARTLKRINALLNAVQMATVGEYEGE